MSELWANVKLMPSRESRVMPSREYREVTPAGPEPGRSRRALRILPRVRGAGSEGRADKDISLLS